jgi:glycosyltransferase involved in cell wall biosynthesis
LAQIGLFFYLLETIRKQSISVLRAGDPLYQGLLGWLLARSAGIPLVVRVGGNNEKVFQSTGKPIMPKLFRSRAIERRVERFVLSRANLVAGANQNNLDFALANGAVPARATLFRYGNLIDSAHFTPPRDRQGGERLLDEFGILPHRFLLYVGRLEAVKQVDHVIRSLANVRERRHLVKLLIVGEGSVKEALAELAEEVGVKDDVVFAGNRDQEWLAQIIPLAGAVVSPHTGRALTEAALGGAPIVAYDVDWQGELITQGQTGELVPEGNWRKMAEAIDIILRDQGYGSRLGANVRELALQMMDRRTLNNHEIAAYESLLHA